MCGIAGFLAPPGERADAAVLTRMIGTLRHRGPDAVGFFTAGRVGLAVARLRILDLASGDQPFATDDGAVQVALNGEVYNFAALRARLRTTGHRFKTTSDTEVVAHLWQDQGEAAVEELDGMFGLAVWDARRETLSLARDRMGEKPLYWARADGWLVFASELRAVLAHPAVDRTPSAEGVLRYLTYDYVPDPHTIVRGVHKLSPAHVLTVAADGKQRSERYWSIPFAPEPAVAEEDWHAAIRGALDEAVRSRLVADVPLGCFLSGGIDSTAIVATAVRFKPGVPTFSVGYAERGHDERGHARVAARRLGTVHEELIVAPADAQDVMERIGLLLDEPIADMSFVPLYLLSRAARSRVTVALTGDGGDELFGGYPAMGAAWWQDAFARLPAAGRRALARVPFAPEPFRTFVASLTERASVRNQLLVGGLAPLAARRLLSPELRAAVAGVDPYRDLDVLMDECPSADPFARLVHRFCRSYLAGQNLANADRASMANALELRAPFLDPRLIALVGRIPAALRLPGIRGFKRLLKQALADRLPPETLRRGKQGFTAPLAEWFRGPLRGTLCDILDPARVAQGGLLDPGAVAGLLSAHLDGREDHGRVLWSLAVLEAWRRGTTV